MEPETAPEKFEDLNTLSLSTIRRTATWIEQHPVIATLVAILVVPLALTVIHGIGISIIATNLAPIGVQIKDIGMGAQTFAVGATPLLIFTGFCVLLYCVGIVGREAPPVMGDIYRSIRIRLSLARGKRRFGRIRALFTDFNSKKAWLRFADRNIKSIILVIICGYFGPAMSSPITTTLQIIFPGLNIPTYGFTIGYFQFLIVALSILMLLQWKTSHEVKAPETPKEHPEIKHENLRLMQVLLRAFSFLLVAAILLLWLAVFADEFYHNMLAELGGGMPRTATVNIKSEYCPELSLNCPNSSLSTVPIQTLIYYEDDQKYLLSIVDDPKPRKIHVVKKEYVTIVSFSPPEKKP